MTKNICIKIEKGFFWLLDSGLPSSPALFFSFVSEMNQCELMEKKGLENNKTQEMKGD